jgi:hypothetical protein
VPEGRKLFSGKPITIILSKTANKREADLHNQATQEHRHKDRAAATQAHQQRQANRHADNTVTVAAYTQQATTNFTGLL